MEMTIVENLQRADLNPMEAGPRLPTVWLSTLS